MSRFSETLLDHARRPKNLGRDEFADVVGRANLGGSPPQVAIYLSINDGHIERATFEAGGCGVTIAACSAMTEIIKGMTVSDAEQVSSVDLAAYLEGVPNDKAHSLEVTVRALRGALQEIKPLTSAPPTASSRECDADAQIRQSDPSGESALQPYATASQDARNKRLRELNKFMPTCPARRDVKAEEGLYFCADPRVVSNHNLVTSVVCVSCESVRKGPPTRFLPFGEVPAERTGPCEFLGDFKEFRTCSSCRGAVRVKVFECIHDKHTDTTFRECEQCSDYRALSDNTVAAT